MFSAELNIWSFLKTLLLWGENMVCWKPSVMFVRSSFGHSPAMQVCGGLVNLKPLSLTKPSQNAVSLAQHYNSDLVS